MREILQHFGRILNWSRLFETSKRSSALLRTIRGTQECCFISIVNHFYFAFNFNRFFFEVLYNKKSTKLEWYIIFLIAAEILIGLFGQYSEHAREGREIERENSAIQRESVRANAKSRG